MKHHHEGSGLDDSSGLPPSNRLPDDSSSGRMERLTLADPATSGSGDSPARRVATVNSSDSELIDKARCDRANCGGASLMRPNDDLSVGLDCRSG